jgi:hypothetical protein
MCFSFLQIGLPCDIHWLYDGVIGFQRERRAVYLQTLRPTETYEGYRVLRIHAESPI